MDEQYDYDDILTFEELLEDDYYKSEFDKRLRQELENINILSGVKGADDMDIIQKPANGEIKADGATPAQATVTPPAEPPKPETKPTGNPADETKQAKQPEDGDAKNPDPAAEMTAEQFEAYNAALRKVSKTVGAELNIRYNAFEDAAAKADAKRRILAGETPDVKAIAADAAARLAPESAPPTETEPKPKPDKAKETDEVAALKAELALIKAGIVPERLEAAKKLFLAEGGDPAKAADFAANYPEWKAGATAGVAFVKSPPVGGKTAPNPISQPTLNDFERKVAAARKRAGLD